MTPSRSAATLMAFILFATVFAPACDAGSSRSSTPAALPLAPTPLQTVGVVAGHAELARCLQGDGPSACFDATTVAALATRAATVAPPFPPLLLPGTTRGNSVSLAWVDQGHLATSFIIEAGSARGLADLANFNTGNALTTFTADGIGQGTYYVRVRAVNAGGVSTPSNEVTLLVQGGCAGPPSGLSLRSGSSSTVQFNWLSSPSGVATSYIIEAGSRSGLSDLASLDTGNSSTSFSASGVGAGTYYVRVRSHSVCGVSAPSNEIVIVVSTGPTAPCPTVTRGCTPGAPTPR
jgi:Fibronectin type III domain